MLFWAFKFPQCSVSSRVLMNLVAGSSDLPFKDKKFWRITKPLFSYLEKFPTDLLIQKLVKTYLVFLTKCKSYQRNGNWWSRVWWHGASSTPIRLNMVRIDIRDTSLICLKGSPLAKLLFSDLKCKITHH